MEELLEQLLTVFIYAPIPLAILLLLIGAAFSESRQTPPETIAPTTKDNSDSRKH